MRSLLLLFWSSLLFLSCSGIRTNNTKVSEPAGEINPVALNGRQFDKIICKSQQYLPSTDSSLCNVVVCFDQPDCISCLIKKLHLWDDVIDYLGRDSLNFYFFIPPLTSSQENEAEYMLAIYYFSQPLYINTEFELPISPGFIYLTDTRGRILYEGRYLDDIQVFSRIKELVEK